jgi:hypothetical protein
VAVRRWWPLFALVMDRVAARVGRIEPRLTVRAFVAGVAVSGGTQELLVAGGAGRSSQPTADAAAVENSQVAAFLSYAWQRYRRGTGSKGPRFYDWALVHIDADTPASTACWSAATAPATSPSTCAGPRHRCRCPPSSPQSAPGGP